MPSIDSGKKGVLSGVGNPENIMNSGKQGVIPISDDRIKSDLMSKTNTSYSGCDIHAIINLNGKLLHIGNLSTISYSIHREKQPVRTLGRIYPKAICRGPLTIAGSLIFTVFDQHVLSELRDVFDHEHNITELQKSLLPHQFPPFDIIITYSNEYGQESVLKIYGVDLIDEGQNHSVNDMVSENMMQYVAKDIDLMIKIGETVSHQNLTFQQALFTSGRNTNTSNLNNRETLRKDLSDYLKYLTELEKEVTLWRNNGENWGDRVHLNIYRIGQIYTLAEAEIFLKTNKEAYKELEKLSASVTVPDYGYDQRRDNPFDYSIRSK